MRLILIIFLLLSLGNTDASAQGINRDASVVQNSKKKKDYGKEFFEKDSIHVIKISFIQCNYWDSLTHYRKIQDSLDISNYMQSTVIVDNKRFYSCGIRFKGESSYEFYPGKRNLSGSSLTNL